MTEFILQTVAYLEIWKGGPRCTFQVYISVAQTFFTSNISSKIFVTSKGGPRRKNPPPKYTPA